MQLIRTLLIPLLALTLFVGYRTYQSNQTRSVTKTRIIQACTGDSACVRQVNLHFERCFSVNYDPQRRSAQLDTAGLVNCLDIRTDVSLSIAEN